MSEEICKNCKYHYTEEISFDYPQSCCNKTNPNHTTEEWLHCDCFEYSKNYITNLQQKVEQLENIRKEAIEATKDVKQFVYDELVDRNVSGATETHCKIMDLLNILNKGSDKE